MRRQRKGPSKRSRAGFPPSIPSFLPYPLVLQPLSVSSSFSCAIVIFFMSAGIQSAIFARTKAACLPACARYVRRAPTNERGAPSTKTALAFAGFCC